PKPVPSRGVSPAPAGNVDFCRQFGFSATLSRLRSPSRIGRCSPVTSWATKNGQFAGGFYMEREPSDGLEPSTPLPVVRLPRKRGGWLGVAAVSSLGRRCDVPSVVRLRLRTCAGRPALPGCSDVGPAGGPPLSWTGGG